jgi:hypothetical protein
MREPLKVIATVGLVLGGVFGIAGTMVPPPLQAAIDGAGLVMATALLTIKYLRTGGAQIPLILDPLRESRQRWNFGQLQG